MRSWLFFLVLGCSVMANAYGNISVVDDAGRTVTIPTVAKRVISLSPHATELLFAAGASDQVVGTIEYSDYPEAAKSIPRIGSFQKIDMERVIALQPDLVIGWKAGGTYDQQQTLMKLGIPVFFSEPMNFQAVAANIRSFGDLLGTSLVAKQKATAFESELSALAEAYAGRKQVSVFYQVWQDPLITINGEHLITRVIEFCGGKNIFAELPLRAPKISMESVLAADPQVVIVGVNEDRLDWLEAWDQWQGMQAVRDGHVYSVDADLIVRQSPRVLLGAKQMCERLDQLR